MSLESLSIADDLPPLDLAGFALTGADLLAQARLKLKPPVHAEKTWPAVAAAAFFAVTALGFATASIMAPPLKLSAAARTSVR